MTEKLKYISRSRGPKYRPSQDELSTAATLSRRSTTCRRGSRQQRWELQQGPSPEQSVDWRRCGAFPVSPRHHLLQSGQLQKWDDVMAEIYAVWHTDDSLAYQSLPYSTLYEPCLLNSEILWGCLCHFQNVPPFSEEFTPPSGWDWGV